MPYSEDTHNTIYGHVPLGVAVLWRGDGALRIRYMNPVFARMMALENPGEWIGRRFIDLWPEEAVREMTLDGELLPGTDYTLPVSAGEDEGDPGLWVKLTIETLTSAEDGPEEIVAWADDISAYKKVENDLHEAVREADAAAEMKANFLATMSHEIRTPMQSVYGLLEMIIADNPPVHIREMAETAKMSASGLLEILDDILDLAKMDANKMELNFFEVPLRTLARGVLEALSVHIHGKNLELIDDIGQDVPYVIIDDPKRLRQVLMNLVGNAIKFTDEGSVTLRITRETRHLPPAKKGLNLRFEVTDTGIGIKKEVCENLFQSFTQADSTTSRKYGGTGLGLSICKKLIELTGGRIGVDSVVGQGSTFWFEIATEEVSTDQSTLDLPSLDGISVLSVEDHPQGSREIFNSLTSMGASVESVGTVKDALELVRRRPFDVGIIDQGLPDGLGLDLVRSIMEIRPFMGLIMYTVRDDRGLQHSLQSLGVPYLSKPASRIGLGQAVIEAARRNTETQFDGATRLLIAEDTESVSDLLKRQLASLGVDADFVTNGQEALEAMAETEYGILFTDLHMPQVDGYELASHIREKEKGTGLHMPIIVLTADVQMAQRQTYLRYGFDECLLKPVSLGQFRRLLIRWGLLGRENEDAAQDGGAQAAPALTSEKTQALTESGGDGKPPAVDVKAMMDMMGMDEAGTIEMLGMFPDMTRNTVDKLCEAAEAGDVRGVKEAAHSIKGGARSACCVYLGDLAAALQEAAEAGSYELGTVEEVVAEFTRVEETIKALKG